MIACANADGEFQGNSGDIVKLWNGMIFELNNSHYNYSYGPKVGVFARNVDYQGKSFVVYKLVVEDNVYRCSRIR